MSTPTEKIGTSSGPRTRLGSVRLNFCALLRGHRRSSASGRDTAAPETRSRELKRTDGERRQVVEFGWTSDFADIQFDAQAVEQPEKRRPWLLLSFLVCVVLPCLVVGIYLLFFASPQYQVETKLTVRSSASAGGTALSSSILNKIGMNNVAASGQDSVIVADYVKSRAIIGDIGGLPSIKERFGKASIDYFSRLGAADGEEKAFEYWSKHVVAQVDGISGIITIRVLGFFADDALDLTNTIIHASEKMLNQLSLRIRQDQLERARVEVETSANDLAEARSLIIEFQERTRTLDPTESAKRILEIITKLRMQYLDIDTELTLSKSIGAHARGDSVATPRPGEQQLEANAEILDSQIKKYESMLVGGGDAALSTQFKEFELLKLRQEFAEKLYTVSRAAYEEARRSLERQQLYLVVVVEPTAPDRPAYPTPFTSVVLLFASLSIGWGILCLLIAAVRDGFSD